MQFKRSRTQILYRYVPGSIFEHDTFGICRVTDVIVTAPDALNEEALKNALKSYLDRWQDFGAESYPHIKDEWFEYKVGVPYRVVFEPFPPIVECTACGHITSLDKLAYVKSADYSCVRCRKGKYRQLPYLIIHNCGKIEPIPLPKCPKHGDEQLRFDDTGRFVTAKWLCIRGDYQRGMPRYKCRCAYSRTSDKPNAANDKYVRINDSSVMYSHTIHFVNLPEKLIRSLDEDPNPTSLILARLWGLVGENVFSLAEKRKAAQTKSTADAKALQLIEQLLKKDPESREARELESLYSSDGELPGDESLRQVEELAPGSTISSPSQALLEFISLQDGDQIDVLDPNLAIENMRHRNDNLGVQDFERGIEFARQQLGINWIGCVTNFPIAMAAIGYSRVSNTPGDAFINPFRTERVDTDRTPVYVVTSDTEGIIVQLDPMRIVHWLLANGFAKTNKPTSQLESWAWLRRNLPALSKFRGLINAPEDLSVAEQAVSTLLHTISHLLMRQVEWSGFDPESVGEYLLPEALTIIIHSNNYTAFTIGGMVTMYEQRLHGWLKDAYNAAFHCVYNPICADEGGSCIGCLHRQYNCESFNSHLSRATLEGGDVLEPRLTVKHGFWTSNF